MNSNVKYRGNQGSNVPNTVAGVFSPSIWHDCPLSRIRNGEVQGSFIETVNWTTDFPLAGTQTTQIAHGKYKVFATADGTVAPVSAINSVEKFGGALKFTAGTTSDNESLSVAQSYPSFRMSGTTTDSGKLWFEAEIAISSIATNTIGFFLGLAEVELWTLATGVPFNAGDAITNSASAIGFRKEEDGLGVVDSVYSDRATSFTNIGDAEGSMAANTLIKYGLVYDPLETTNCVTFWENGVKLTTALSRSALVALTNLDANALGIMFSQINDASADAVASYITRWRCFQLGPN
jgi:hypothetical protein